MARELPYKDFEGDMAKAQLQKIEMYAAKLNDMIHPEDEIESWVQSKLSVVAAYMGDIKHYLDYQLKEYAEGGFTPEDLKHFKVKFKYEIDTERIVDVYANNQEEAEDLAEAKFSPYYDDFEITEVSSQQMKHGGITDYFDEAEEYVGTDKWEDFTYEEKVKATEYLRLKGRIGDFLEEEDDDDDYDEKEYTDEDFDKQYSEEDTYDIYTISAMQYAKGGKTKWIQDAIKHKGALRRAAQRQGLIEGEEKLSMADLKKLEREGGKTGKRARLAETLRTFKK